LRISVLGAGASRMRLFHVVGIVFSAYEFE
jgi:hypothetical protein